MNWVEKSISASKKLRTHYKMKNIDIYIKDMLPDNINPDVVFGYISKRVPKHLLSQVDIIYVGQFDEFKETDTNAMYNDGAIYVTNEQDNIEDMIDDVIHEIAHSVEEKYYDHIYGDQLLKKEFLGKRQRLYSVLHANDYKPYKKVKNTFNYDEEIDMYFYSDVGYDNMWYLVVGLFPSPYAATSIREYFAVGFEHYYLKDRSQLKKECPFLYNKLAEIEFPED
tara:strand:- start:1609 stop:2280 length:672 start_codon:yes stop_codon:yes gene_type:complete